MALLSCSAHIVNGFGRSAGQKTRQGMSLTPEEIAALIEQVDAVRREAQELQDRLREAMADRGRQDQQLESNGAVQRRVRLRRPSLGRR